LPEETDSLERICRLVEGMPLALELAAAWVDSLSLTAIAAELQDGLDLLASDLVDLPERQRSIRTTFDATWRRLEPAEQESFMRLSVFRGGLTRAAAQQVAGATLPMLAQLIGKCLVQFKPAGERYHLHEVLRQYGRERLAESTNLDLTQRQHFEYFATLAETAHAGLFGAEQVSWLERLEAEHDNLRAALDWGFAQPPMAGAVAGLVIDLAWFWRIRSHVLEGRTWLERALLLPGLAAATRAGLLYHGGHLAWMQDDFALASARAEASLRLWESLGSAGRRGAAYASHTLGMARYGTELRVQGDLTSAIGAFETSLALFKEAGDEWGIAFALQWLAFSLTALGEREAAVEAAEESLAGFRRLGNPWGAGMTLGALANLRLQAGDPTAARRLAEEAQALRRQVGHRHSIGVGLELLARIALQENRPDEAAAYYLEAIQVFEGLGNRPYADQMRAAASALVTQ
jgi:non-specific serine/threonine protein kinase